MRVLVFEMGRRRADAVWFGCLVFFVSVCVMFCSPTIVCVMHTRLCLMPRLRSGFFCVRCASPETVTAIEFSTVNVGGVVEFCAGLFLLYLPLCVSGAAHSNSDHARDLECVQITVGAERMTLQPAHTQSHSVTPHFKCSSKILCHNS